MPFRGIGKDVLRVVDPNTLSQTSGCFISRLCARLHKCAKTWSTATKTSVSEETNAGNRSYAGKKYLAPLPAVEDGLQSFADECHRYLSATINVKEAWTDKSGSPDMQSAQMSLAQLIRSMKLCTKSMTENSLSQAYLHLKIAESYCESDTRFHAVFSALPWQYLVDCRKSIIEESQRNEQIRSDQSKFQGLIREAASIADLVEIIRSMSDIARVEIDGPEVRAKYRMLSKELGDFKWEVLNEGTLLFQGSLHLRIRAT